MVCSQLSPVVYRVRRVKETREVSVHIAHIKLYRARNNPPSPDFDKLSEFFLGRTIPLPKIESYVVENIISHKSGRGPKTPFNSRYRIRLKGYSPESDLLYRADEIPQCQELIAASRIRFGLEIAPPTTASPRKPTRKDDT